jgi:hypothetical protein
MPSVKRPVRATRVKTREFVDKMVEREVVHRLEVEIVRMCELHPRIGIAPPGSLPKTEFKARRVIDRRTAL